MLSPICHVILSYSSFHFRYGEIHHTCSCFRFVDEEPEPASASSTAAATVTSLLFFSFLDFFSFFSFFPSPNLTDSVASMIVGVTYKVLNRSMIRTASHFIPAFPSRLQVPCLSSSSCLFCLSSLSLKVTPLPLHCRRRLQHVSVSSINSKSSVLLVGVNRQP